MPPASVHATFPPRPASFPQQNTEIHQADIDERRHQEVNTGTRITNAIGRTGVDGLRTLAQVAIYVHCPRFEGYISPQTNGPRGSFAIIWQLTFHG